MWALYETITSMMTRSVAGIQQMLKRQTGMADAEVTALTLLTRTLKSSYADKLVKQISKTSKTGYLGKAQIGGRSS